MKVLFKNGKEMVMQKEVAEAINKNILDGYTANWQTFSTGGKVFLILNLSEVACICEEED